MKDLKGYIMVLGAALLWGASATAAKLLLNQHVDTITIVQARVTFTTLLFLPWLLIFRRPALVVPWRDLWKFLLLGVGGVAGANFTYYFTIKESTVATAILIQYTAPLLVMAWAAWIGEERFTGVTLGAALLSLLGCFLAVGGYDTQVLKITPLALLTGIGSIVSFAFWNVYARQLLHRYSFWTVTFYAIAGAALFWLFIRPPWTYIGSETSVYPWGGLMVLAVVSILIPHTLYANGLRFIAPSRAIITSTMEPVVAIASAAWVLGEYLAGWQIVGAVLVLAAIVLLQLRREPAQALVQTTSEAGHAPHRTTA